MPAAPMMREAMQVAAAAPPIRDRADGDPARVTLTAVLK